MREFWPYLVWTLFMAAIAGSSVGIIFWILVTYGVNQ